MASLESARRKLAHRVVLLLAALGAGIGVVPGTAQAAPNPGVQMNAADMTLLNGVRLAGLWEMPAGQMAAEKGQSAGYARSARRSPSSTRSWTSWWSRRPTSSAPPCRRIRRPSRRGG
ncbi:hypothetical protein V2I01_08455 [Micromonospora sp. BRA006-A]|nr:hypothetical protein [Micromonospora sp. BRA006-A]